VLNAAAANTVAGELVIELRKTLQVDDNWAIRTTRGFGWWPHWFRQDMWAEPAHPSREMHVARVVVETDLVSDMPARLDASALSAFIAKAGVGDQASFLSGDWDVVRDAPLLPGLSGIVMYGQRVRLRSSVLVHGETQDWIKHLIAVAATEHLAVVDTRAAPLAAALGGKPTKSEHPSSGLRERADEMVNAAPSLAATEKHTSWTNLKEFTTTAADLTSKGFVSTTDEGQGAFRGLTAEVPSGPRPGYAIQGGDSHMIMATTQHAHPTLGPGLLMRLLLRHSPRVKGVSLSAVDLNTLEATQSGEGHFIGSWCGPENALQFTAFLPNVLYRPGAMQIFCYSFVGRAHWIDSLE
jgi:hypothetical protein